MSHAEPYETFGLMAEFSDPERLLDAVRQARAAGYRQVDAYSPYEIEGLGQAMGIHRNAIPVIMLLGGLSGSITGYALQWWVSASAYPINVGGKPYNSWPMFIPVIFELTVLFASLSGLFGMLILNGLPKPYHPVFNVEAFARASQDRFFLVIERDDPQFDEPETRSFLQRIGAGRVDDVPA